MRLAHISDLHIGKRLNDFSLIDDQEYILNQILKIVFESNVDGVIIAGDVYDKSTPSTEAITLFDSFLVALAERKIKTFIISGNHDSNERLAFANRLIGASGVYISSVFSGTADKITLKDKYGNVNFYLLPFIKPTHVRKLTDNEVETYTDALRVAIDSMKIDTSERNVLITHQFVTGASRCDSEEISVGGSDNVDASVMAEFDYVALGHLHKPQSIESEKIRYSGSPLKYSFSESKDVKSVTVVELNGKKDLKIDTYPLVPKRDMVEIKGTYAELMERKYYEGTTYGSDYMHVTLTDEEDVCDAVNLLRTVYKNLMKLDYDNQRTRESCELAALENVENKTPNELFAELYEKQNNKQMSIEQEKIVNEIISQIWEEEL